MFKDRKLAFKQMLGFLLVSAILITVVFVGYRSIGHINTTLQSILRTIPLVEASKEIKIAVAQDLQAVMGLVSALDTDELDHVWQEHETYKQRINTYTVAIMEGGEIDSGFVHPTQDESLKATVDKVRHFYNTTFEPKLSQIYTLMVKKVSAETYDYELLETLPEEAKAIGTQLATLLGGVESAAKTAIQSAGVEAQSATARANTGLLLAAGIGILVAVALALFITRIMTRPIAEAVRFTEQMADGDLSRTLNILQKDEIGVLAQALNQMVGSLGTMFKEVTNGVHTLTDSSKHLLDISGKMSHNAENTSERSNLVATAAEEMSTNMDSVSAATDQAAGNISRLAAATEKINATMTQISTHSDSARAISQKALTKINAISEAVTTLGTAAVEIDEVTDGIRDISEQVNLLALNATIEAARAGEAGKGFAVVAQEIKALAHQTADATHRADDKLHWIQTRSTDLVASVGDISQFFGEIHTIITDIAEAVDHQSVTTRETAANLAETSTGIQTVNTHVSQSSEVARVIAQDISEVHHTSSDFSDSSAQVDQRAQDLNRLAESLTEMVNQFKL